MSMNHFLTFHYYCNAIKPHIIEKTVWYDTIVRKLTDTCGEKWIFDADSIWIYWLWFDPDPMAK